MEIEFKDYFGEQLKLKPRVELYSVKDFTGKKMPGLAVVFDTADEDPEQYGVLTVSFGEMIGMKDCAYIDVNNFPGAEQLLGKGIAEDTGFTKRSGFCEYPLWHFKKEFLEECGGDNYRRYYEAYDSYFDTGEDETQVAPAGSDDGLTMM